MREQAGLGVDTQFLADVLAMHPLCGGEISSSLAQALEE
jgi:hypothetical protein